MASSDKKRKTKQGHKPGSGWARAKRASRAMARTLLKIKRWKRYQAEVEAGTRKLPTIKYGKRKGELDTSRWDTTGLESYLAKQESIVNMGKTS